MVAAVVMVLMQACVGTTPLADPSAFMPPEHQVGHKCNKKLNRLLRKCPGLQLQYTDTIVDTMYVEAEVIYVHDTLWLPGDTIRVEGDRVAGRIVRVPTGGPCDTVEVPVYYELECKADTIVKTVEVKVPGVRGGKTGVAPWYRTGFFILLALAALAIALNARK